MAAKRRKLVTEDFNLGNGSTTIPTDSGGTRAATLVGIHTFMGGAYVSAADFPGADPSDAGTMFRAAHAKLPNAGGTIDARSLNGTTWKILGDVVFTKPILLLLGKTTYTASSLTSAAIQLAAGSMVAGASSDASIITVSSTAARGIKIAGAGCVIQDVGLSGPGGGPTTGSIGIDSGANDHCTIQRCDVSNFASVGINGGGGNNWRVLSNLVHGNYQAGIQTNVATDWVIDGNHSYSNGSNGIDTNAQRGTITNNHVYSNGANYSGTAIDCDGILVSSTGGNADDNIVSGNIVRANSCVGIRIRADGSNSASRNIVSKNSVRDHPGATGYGILIDTSIGASCGTTNDNLLSDNLVYNNNQHGIFLGGGTCANCTVNRNRITGNQVISNAQTGIYTYCGNDAQVNNNTALLNTVAQTNINGGVDVRSQDFNNKTDATVNLCKLGNGTMEFNTLRPASGVVVSLSSTGNTELEFKSDAGGAGDYAILLDTGGNFYPCYDLGHGAARITVNSTGTVTIAQSLAISAGTLSFVGINFASLGTPGNGTIVFCGDCNIANPCTGGGSGALAKRLAGAWVCN